MDLRGTNDNNNKNLIDVEMGALEKFESELKNTIFGVFFLILKESEVSIYVTFLSMLVQFVQLLIFPFHTTINGVWNSESVVDVLHTMVNYLNIVPYIEDTTWDLYVTFFYIGVFVIGFAVVMIFYVSYAFSHKKVAFSWPIIALRYNVRLMMSVLFLPFLDYFVSMIACVKNPITGLTVHSYFTDVECWASTHIAHAVIAIFCALVFLSISALASLTCFEYRDVSSDPTSRTSSRPYFLIIVYKTVMVVCLTFLTDPEFQVLLLALILSGSTLIFSKFYQSSPYHNEIISKLWSILTAINLWTAVMLVFAKVLEKSLFEGSIFVWILGIPFAILIILTTGDSRVRLLLINVNKFQSAQDVENQMRYLLKMIEWQANKKNSSILLDGYIEIHKQTCDRDDCPLKQKNIKNKRFSKNLMNQDETLNEKYGILIQLVYNIYSDAIKKFPNSTSLRLAYAFFLLEKMQSKQQALQELSQAEQNKPPLDEQFVIFRYKRIIEDEIAESQVEGQGGLDVVSEISFQNHLRQLQANIEKSALLHMEFWSQLYEDSPDLGKLNDIGGKINSSVHNVEEYWNKLLKINKSNAKAMRLYGKYLIEIINDKEAGDLLIEKARDLSNTQVNRRAIQMIGAGGDDLSHESTPIVWVSGEQSKFGQISGINLAAASMFGYNKGELLFKKINMLMPQIFAKHHDLFMEAYMNAGEGVQAEKNKERLVLGKNKSNYLFPVYYSVRVVQSIIQGTQFIATFRMEKSFKNAAYVLTDPDGTIDSISASAISLLKIDQKIITYKKANIEDLIPNIITNKQSLFTTNNAGRSMATITYNYPEDSEYILENEEISAQMNCYLNDLILLQGRENAGYQFRFERILDKSLLNPQVEKIAKISNFQFRFDRRRASVVGEYAEGSTDIDYCEENSNQDEVLGGLHSDQESSDHERDRMMISAQRSQPEEPVEEEPQRMDYGIGIRTLRLVGGRAQEIRDHEDEEEEEEEGSPSKEAAQIAQNKKHQQLVEQEEESQEEGSYNDFSTTFKSRKALTSVISDKTIPPAINTLRIAINALGVFFLAIAVTDYAIAATEFDKINMQVELLDLSNLRLAEMMNVLAKVRDLTLVNMGLLDDMYPNVTVLTSRLKTSLDTVKGFKQQLEQETSSLSTPHLALLNQPSILLVSLSSGNTSKGLTQATEEIISRAYDLVSRNITEFTAMNSDVYFVTYNLLNNFSVGLAQSSQHYTAELMDRVDKKANSFLYVLIASVASLAVVLAAMFPILLKINQIRGEVLSLFLDIPEKTVKGLYTKCETFISNLQVGEDDDMVSELDDEEMDKPDKAKKAHTKDFLPRRRRKRFKNSNKNKHDFFIKFLVVMAIFEGYFIYAYVSSIVLLDDIGTLIPEYNATSAAESFFSFSNDAQRQLFINNTVIPIMDQQADIVARRDISAMYSLQSFILEEHSVNKKIHTNSYNTVFNNIMMSIPCTYISSYVTNSTCAAFADQTLVQGMTVGMSRHIENLRSLLLCYINIKADSTKNCTVTPNVTKTVTSDVGENKILNLLRTKIANETEIMQHVYIKRTFRVLMQEFKTSIKETFDNQLTIRLAIFIVFIILISLVYALLWQTLIGNMSNEIWRTKSMLNMIPLNVIAKIKSIRLYVKRFWNDMNVREA